MQAKMKFFQNLGEGTFVFIFHVINLAWVNLDPTLGVAMGVKGVYPYVWEVRVGRGSR